MIRLLLKLAVAALIANATWRIGSAYTTLYRFKDSVTEVAQFNGDRSDDQLRQKILELGVQFEIPVTEDSFTLRRIADHLYINGSYTQAVEVVPGYRYPWPFTWNVETLTLRGHL